MTRPHWYAAIALDGEPHPFILIREGVVHTEDGEVVRFPTDLEASRIGLKMYIAERKARREPSEEEVLG